MKKRWLSLTVSFLYAGFAQAYECVKPKTKRPEGCSQQMPDDLIPLYKMFRFTYVPNILDTVNANNDTGGNGGGGSGNGGTGGYCSIEDPYGEYSTDDEPYECEGEFDCEIDNE